MREREGGRQEGEEKEEGPRGREEEDGKDGCRKGGQLGEEEEEVGGGGGGGGGLWGMARKGSGDGGERTTDCNERREREGGRGKERGMGE